MQQKTILLIDDEQGLLEALEDALTHLGFRVLKASTGEEALTTLAREHVDLATIDVMMPPGPSLETKTSSQRTGLYVCKEIVRLYPKLELFCLSVVNDREVIKEIQSRVRSPVFAQRRNSITDSITNDSVSSYRTFILCSPNYQP